MIIPTTVSWVILSLPWECSHLFIQILMIFINITEYLPCASHQRLWDREGKRNNHCPQGVHIPVSKKASKQVIKGKWSMTQKKAQYVNVQISGSSLSQGHTNPTIQFQDPSSLHSLHFTKPQFILFGFPLNFQTIRIYNLVLYYICPFLLSCYASHHMVCH